MKYPGKLLIAFILLSIYTIKPSFAEGDYREFPYDKKAREWYTKAQDSFARGQITKTYKHFIKAIGYVNNGIAIEKDFLPFYILKGNILEFGEDGRRFTQGCNLFEAEKAYKQLLAIDEAVPKAYHSIGLVKYRQGKVDIAIKYLKKAIEIYPGMGISFNALGDIYFDLGQYREAIKSYYESMSRNPISAVFKTNIAKCSLRIAQQEPASKESALRLCRRMLYNALTFDPDYLDAYFWLAAFHAEIGNTNAAMDYLKVVMRMEPYEYREKAKVEPAFKVFRANEEFIKMMIPPKPLPKLDPEKQAADIDTVKTFENTSVEKLYTARKVVLPKTLKKDFESEKASLAEENDDGYEKSIDLFIKGLKKSGNNSGESKAVTEGDKTNKTPSRWREEEGQEYSSPVPKKPETKTPDKQNSPRWRTEEGAELLRDSDEK